ncbi:helix-turn-helix transcriptional regulator [Spirosoma harenae]
MSINDKIKQILIDKNLTPSYFADEIGVQRSSISHILSGRNRPSFDIIQKIIRRFPELGYDWIMEEEANYGSTGGNQPSGYPNRGPVRPNGTINNGQSSIFPYATQPTTTIRSQRNEIPPISTPPIQQVQEPVIMSAPAETNTQTSALSEKKVERILIFYTDGSFKEYMPSA